MGENVGSGGESEFDSVTSSQLSLLNTCPFADPAGVEDTHSNSTEVLETPISPPVTHTPILSLSTPISLDSINDEDVFRTPPENASLSSAAESEPRARVSEIKPRGRGGGGGLKLKSPSTTTRTPVSASASLTVKNVRVLETNRTADVTPLTSPPPPRKAAGNVEISGGGSRLKSPSTVSLLARTVRALEMDRLSDPKEPVTEEVRPLSSPTSLAGSTVRVTGKRSGLDSPSPRKRLDLESSPQSVTERIKVSESRGDDGVEIPLKDVIEALLRNSGESLRERDERVSCTDILKQLGLKFP